MDEEISRSWISKLLGFARFFNPRDLRWLYVVCKFNTFTYAVETIMFWLYSQVNLENSVGIITCTILFLTFSIIGYDPARRFIQKKGR